LDIWTIYRWGWLFLGRRSTRPTFLSSGAFGAAWDDAMVVRWSANPLGMLWPATDAAFVTSGGGNGGPPAVARRPVVIIAAG
jgi:hypothetical protein